MTKVLITGASGFVGNNLARYLLAQGHAVHLLLRSGHAHWRLSDIANDVTVHEVDLRDVESVKRAVSGIRPEWIFHLAAHGAYSFQTDADQILATNIAGTANLLHACLDTGFEVFVNTGSSSEYGFKDHAPREHEGLEPNSYYAVGKASATLLCGYLARSRKVRIPTLRLYSVFGPYEDPARLMPVLILKGLENTLPPLVNPEVARDFVYVDDVIQAYLLAATVPDQEPAAIYNVGTGVQTTLRRVVEVASETLRISSEPEWASMPDRIWDTDTWVSDNRLIREQLGWKPAYTFEQGFHRMAEWFRSNPRMTNLYREMQSRPNKG
jgi:dolichol-phosphate mannosyltransferase